MAIRNYVNAAEPQTLTADVDDVDVTLQVGDTSTYPPAPFIVVMDRRGEDQEVCLCTGKTATAFTVTRGFDGSTAVAHLTGTAVEHTSAAVDYTEANAHNNTAHLSPTLVDAKGDLFTATAADTPARLPVGADGYSLVPEATEATGLRWEKSRGTIVCTSTTRPTLGLYDGVRIFETDSKLFYLRVGGAWMPEPGQCLGFSKLTANTAFTSGNTQRMSLAFTMPTLTTGRRVKLTATAYFLNLAAPHTGHHYAYTFITKSSAVSVCSLVTSGYLLSATAVGISASVGSIDNTDIPAGATTIYYYTMVINAASAQLSHQLCASVDGPAYLEAMII